MYSSSSSSGTRTSSTFWFRIRLRPLGVLYGQLLVEYGRVWYLACVYDHPCIDTGWHSACNSVYPSLPAGNLGEITVLVRVRQPFATAAAVCTRDARRVFRKFVLLDMSSI